MYLSNIQILSDHRCFKQGQSFELQDITLLVGDQGCGKSTLLEGLHQHSNFLKVSITALCEKGVETFFFDSEKMNPRIKNPNDYSNPDGTNRGIGVGNALRSRFGSHGETMVAFTVDAIKKAKDCILFLDEPESGLSLKNQFRLWDQICAAAKRRTQLIISTHSLALINSVESVLSLEHGKWMSSKEFIESNKMDVLKSEK